MVQAYLCGLDPSLSPASFRGVVFEVDTDQESYGRRIVTHEYTMRDDPYHEDLGEKFQSFSITGYVWGEDSIAQKEAVVAAARSRGPGLLQLPAKPAFLAVCPSLKVTRSVAKQGYFELTFEFHRDDGVTGFPIIGSAFEQMIMTAALAAVDNIRTLFDSTFNGFGAQLYATDNAVGILQSFAQVVVDTLNGNSLTGSSETAAAIMHDALGIFSNAEEIVRPTGYTTFGNDGQIVQSNVYSALTGSPAPVQSPTLVNPLSSAVILTMGGIFDRLSQVLAPSDAVVVFQGLAAFSVGETVATPSPIFDENGRTGLSVVSVSDQKNQDNATALNGSVRMLALMQFARAVAATNYTSRVAAIQARADLVELFNQQIDRVLDDVIANNLVEIRDMAVKALSVQITNTASVITVQANGSMPSLYWAFRLYDDANRADELIDRNDVPCPAFMPSTFEALRS